MNVEEAKDFRLGIAEGVNDGTRFKRTIFAKFDHHFHAERPLASVGAIRHAKMRVDGAPDRADWPIADDGEQSVDVHARHESILR